MTVIPPGTLAGPQGITANLYIADTGNNLIRQGTTPMAGNGSAAFAGDNGPATLASFSGGAGVVMDQAGNMYIADGGDNRIRKVDTSGNITTYAGNGTAGYSGDGGPALAASMNGPGRLAIDAAGNLYIAEGGNAIIRKVDASGNISTVAGNGTICRQPAPPGSELGQVYCYTGDGGPAISASLGQLSGVALDGADDVYISDSGNNLILRVDAVTGTITTMAGNGTICYNTPPTATGPLSNTCFSGPGGMATSGDGGLATSATLFQPQGIVLDGAGNLYIADQGNSRIREVSGGIITTVAGNGSIGFSGDGGPATYASLWPAGVFVDKAGGLLISDGSGRIRNAGNTPTGNNVAVLPVSSTPGTPPVALTFPSITQSGNTSLTTSSSGPATPSGFTLGSPPTYYNLTTSAVYSGSITICINYNGVSYTDPNALSIWHYDTTVNNWVQLTTTSLDTATTTICASTPSLSPFAILQPLGPSLAFSAKSLAFGNQQEGTVSATRSVNLSVSGAALRISSINLSGSFFAFVTKPTSCPYTGGSVAAGASCTLDVAFTPVGHAGLGAQTGSISIADNAAGSPQSISLSGTGIDTLPPTISITANPSPLWPPNGQLLPVKVSGAITDSGSGVNPSALACKVVDSYGLVQPACSVGTLGAGGAYSFTVSLVASRNGNDKNGRTYTITVSASDYAGNPASVSTPVIVPHDQGN
jgi:hypothetical protein